MNIIRYQHMWSFTWIVVMDEVWETTSSETLSDVLLNEQFGKVRPRVCSVSVKQGSRIRTNARVSIFGSLDGPKLFSPDTLLPTLSVPLAYIPVKSDCLGEHTVWGISSSATYTIPYYSY
jgi:hypothetical protein